MASVIMFTSNPHMSNPMPDGAMTFICLIGICTFLVAWVIGWIATR